MNATMFNEFYEKIMEDMTSAALGPNTELYSDLGTPTADTWAPGDARRPKILGKGKVFRRKLPKLQSSNKKLKKTR